ncbi:VCBS repeat-containing protein, partial [Kitasatospora sp. NPDC087861]
MSRISRVAARSLATLVAAGIGATMFTATATATATAPAQAASTAGGTITRSEVLARAQSWVDEGVPYNKGGCKTDANGTYREDCSGYVSMAWHLTSSLTTQSLPSVSTSFSDFSQLKPGDALDYTAEHTFLFANWTNKANGDFTYYAESNAHNPTRGPTSANINSSSLEGWPTSFYTGLRYKNIVDDKKPSSIGAYDPGTGTFYEGNQAGATLGSAKFGNPEWKPLAGDWNGTGTSKVGAYDPSTATF